MLSEEKLLRTRPLLILALVAAALASVFSVLVGTQSHTGDTSSTRGWHSGGPTIASEETVISWRIVVVVLIPLALCIAPMLRDKKPGATLVIAVSTAALTIFVVISAASVGMLFFPSVLLMGLALRRSIARTEGKARGSAMHR